MGIATLALTALDLVDILKYNADLGSSMMDASPGLGMYLAYVLGAALALAVLTYINLVATLLASRMAFDAYGSTDIFALGLFEDDRLTASKYS